MRKASISAAGLFRQEKALMRYHSVKRDYLPDLLFLINRILTLIIGPERILMLYTKVFSNSGIYNDNTKLYENGLVWNMSMYILWVAILTMMLRIMFCGVLMLISNILCSGNRNILSQLWMKKCLFFFHQSWFSQASAVLFHPFWLSLLVFPEQTHECWNFQRTVSLSPILRQGSVSEMKVIAIMMPSTYQSLNKYLLNEWWLLCLSVGKV